MVLSKMLKHYYKQKLLFFITILVLLSIPITVFVILSNLDNRSRAALTDAQELEARRTSLFTEREGFAKSSNVTGGANGSICRVTNLNDSGTGSLRNCSSLGNRWIVFSVSGTINLSTTINIASNTTIDGRGANIVIRNRGVNMSTSGTTNFIVTDITIAAVRGGTCCDALTTRGSGSSTVASRYWLHHITFKEFISASDGTDEYMDLTGTKSGGTFATVSYVKFERTSGTDELTMLTGDGGGAANQHLLNLTMHHNWFDGVRQRQPLMQGGKIHSYNNLRRWRLYGAQVRSCSDNGCGQAAQFLSENDIFDGSSANAEKAGQENRGVYLHDNQSFAKVTGAYLLNGAGYSTNQPSSVFNPSSYYSYSLETANSSLKSKIEANAGARPANQFNFEGGSAATPTIQPPTLTPTPTIPPVITPSDTTPPTISNVNVSNVTTTTATISWTTNEPSTSQVEICATSSRCSNGTSVKPELVTSHSVGIGFMTPGTNYFIFAKSKDTNGNERVSGPHSFTTLSNLTPTPTRTPTPTPTIQPPTPTTPPTGITPTQTPSKTGDINRDSNVDIFDLSILLSNWNTTNANADLNNDDQVNIFDLSILLSNWGL